MFLAGNQQVPNEGIPRRAASEKEQVRFAVAVRCSEANQWNGRARQRAESPRPHVLPAHPVVAVPDLFKRCMPSKVVDVPVWAAGRLQVVREPGEDTPGAVGAADINVKSGLEPQPAKPSDPDESIRSRGKYQSIRSRFGFDRCELVALPILSLEGAHRTRVHNCFQPRYSGGSEFGGDSSEE